MTWPTAVLSALGEAIYRRGVDLEVVLSNGTLVAFQAL